MSVLYTRSELSQRELNELCQSFIREVNPQLELSELSELCLSEVSELSELSELCLSEARELSELRTWFADLSLLT